MNDDDAAVPLTRVFDERVLYESPWVRLVQVKIGPPDGRRFWHHVVRLQTVATAVVLDDDRTHVLMLRRHRFATDEVGWELPGGIVGPDETAAAAAAREVREETGWLPRGAGRRLVRFQPMPGMVGTPHEVLVFVGAEKVGEPTDQEEAALVEWFPLNEVAEAVHAGEVLGSGSIVGLLGLLSAVLPEA